MKNSMGMWLVIGILSLSSTAQANNLFRPLDPAQISSVEVMEDQGGHPGNVIFRGHAAEALLASMSEVEFQMQSGPFGTAVLRSGKELRCVQGQVARGTEKETNYRCVFGGFDSKGRMVGKAQTKVFSASRGGQAEVLITQEGTLAGLLIKGEAAALLKSQTSQNVDCVRERAEFFCVIGAIDEKGQFGPAPRDWRSRLLPLLEVSP